MSKPDSANKKNLAKKNGRKENEIDIDSEIICKQIEQFYQIIRVDFVENILKLKKLLQERDRNPNDNQSKEQQQQQQAELSLRKYPECELNETELEKHFPKLRTKNEVRQYQNRYNIGLRPLGNAMDGLFLLPNGMFPTNRNMNNFIDLIQKYFATFYRLTSSCSFTFELIAFQMAFRERNVTEHKFIQTLVYSFKKFSSFGLSQCQSLKSSVLERRSSYIMEIACKPQLDGLRIAARCWEKEAIEALWLHLNDLYFSYLFLYNMITKNGSKLSDHMSQIYRKHKKILLKN